MKRIILGTLLCSIAGCSSVEPGSSEAESVGESKQELNGSLSETGFLVGGGLFGKSLGKNLPKRKTLEVETSETERQKDTQDPNELLNPGTSQAYYDRVQISVTGKGANITTGLSTLAAFRNAYGFESGDGHFTAKYYNRGDLGIGREMHCRKTTLGAIACYVTNYSAGPANVDGQLNEFTFGFSPQIAFSNMEAGKPFATVAMVYRPKAPTNKVIFIVYDAEGKLQPFAALDRHGINFANKKGVDPKDGIAGINVNNHVPTNCLNCHGGKYTRADVTLDPPRPIPTVEDAAFLPFDLDQFDYKPASGFSRDEEEFLGLNQYVREVAVGVKNSSVTDQLDAWYKNTDHLPALPANKFDGSQVVAGWRGSEGIYQSVVRPSCRGCHVTSALKFDSATEFLANAELIGTDIRNHVMPHALQTQRLFWQSGQPKQLADYFNDKLKTQAAIDVAAGSPANIVTLDPHLLSTF